MEDTLTLCATARLAQALRGEVVAGNVSWRTPGALTVGQWLAMLAEEARLTGTDDLAHALEPYGECVLWEKVIAPSLPASDFFDLAGLAATAAEAHALCRTWNLAPGGDALSDEARLFSGWQAAFERRCRADGLLDAAGIERRIVALLEDGAFTLPGVVAFAGFDRMTPLETRLASALAARGCRVEILPPGAVDRSTAAVVACADPAAECAAAAVWARDRLAANPDARLAIVAPDLAAVRDRLEFLLDDLLHPALLRPEGAGLPRRFNFSLGRPLAGEAPVAVALALLGIATARGKVEQARLSALLLAGGWAAAVGEADGRARLDAAMRRELPYFTTPAALQRLAARLAERGDTPCPQTCAALAACLAALDGPARRRPGEWAAAFRAGLRAAGWPGDRPLASREFQAREAFAGLLEGLARLDPLLGPIPSGEALRRLRELAGERLFQPETRGHPQLQVLGMLESAGLTFDALWVMGMNDDRWPPAPRPNPLLPVELQRAAGVARASAEVELDFARRVHARLLRSAPAVTFSFARADGNRTLRPSPLIAGIPAADPAGPTPATVASVLAAAAPAGIVAVDDASAPPVADGEKVSGGSWLLRAQAVCPAWAFHRYRLGAEALEAPVEGLDPRARGTLVHAALEAFWLAVGDSQELHRLVAADLDAAIAAAVEKGIAAFEDEGRARLPVRFRQLEGSRLAQLLATWLAIDASREHKFAIEACERGADLDIEGIRVRVVLDRVDRVATAAGDRHVVIDYKTGNSIDVANWAGERITEPQLPIYAAFGGDVAGVAFAKVLPDKPAFAGIAAEAGLLPGVAGLDDERRKLFERERFPDWAAVLAHWQARLEAVAREVKAGVAGVACFDDKALRHCDVLPVLRLAERRRLLAAALAADSRFTPPPP